MVEIPAVQVSFVQQDAVYPGRLRLRVVWEDGTPLELQERVKCILEERLLHTRADAETLTIALAYSRDEARKSIKSGELVRLGSSWAWRVYH